VGTAERIVVCMDATIIKPLLIFKKSTLIRRIFYAVLILVAFVSNDPSRTIVLSSSYGIYIPVGSLIFLVGGGIVTLIGFKKFPYMPKVLVIAGPVFAAYVLLQTALRVIAGATYSVEDIFYTVVELMNIILAIGIGYCYIHSLKRKDIFALQPLCYTILVILTLYYTAIFASQVVLPLAKSLTEIGVTVDDLLLRGIDRSIGFRRLYGPLGHSTSLGLVLIPISGYNLYLLRIRPKTRYLFSFFMAGVLIILTGSRVAIFGYVVLLLYYFLNRFRACAVLPFVLSFLVLLLLYREIVPLFPQKLNPFNKSTYLDNRRFLAFLTCCNAWLSTSSSFLFGAGYDKIVLITKKWFLSAAGMTRHGDIITVYGWLPGGPHSIFNWAISNTGLVGFLLRCSFIYHFVFTVIRKSLSILNKPYSVLVVSVCISFLNLLTDDSHVIYPMLMACWFVFYIFAVRLLSTNVKTRSLERGCSLVNS